MALICGMRQAACECVLPLGHAGPHECVETCGGSWEYLEDGYFRVVAFPNGVWVSASKMWE